MLLLVALASGCAAKPLDLGFGVALQLRFGASVTDEALARVVTLRFHATGDVAHDDSLALGRAAQRSEALVYRPAPGTRFITVLVTAEDGAGNVLAEGSTATLTLSGNDTVESLVELEAAPMLDSGVDAFGDGTGDMAMPDASEICAPGGPPQVCSVGGDVYICDGFEETGAFQFSYTCAGDNFGCGPPTGDTLVEHSTTPPLCHGNQVFHAATGAVARHDAYLGLYLPGGASEFFLRVFAYKKTGSADVRFLSLFERTQSDLGTPTGYAMALTWVGENQFSLDGQVFTHPGTATDKWTCVELYVKGDPMTGDFKLWVDEDFVGDIAGPNVDPQYYYNLLALGVFASSSVQPIDVYFDELVLSKSRIHCR